MRISSSDGHVTNTEDDNHLKSLQEEADCRIILHLLKMAPDMAEDQTIAVSSPDTDVFILRPYNIDHLFHVTLVRRFTDTENHLVAFQHKI